MSRHWRWNISIFTPILICTILASASAQLPNDSDVLAVKKSVEERDAALAKLKVIKAKNEVARKEYEEKVRRYDEEMVKHEGAVKKDDARIRAEVSAFIQAKLECEAFRALKFGKKFTTDAGRTKWHSELIKDFPGTKAAKEAQRRLNGFPDKDLAEPPVPVNPETAKRPKRPTPPEAPLIPKYEAEPTIPAIITLEQAREIRLTQEATRKKEAKQARLAQVKEAFTANELVTAAKNGISFDKEFRNKRLTVTGVINKTGKATHDKMSNVPYVSLKGGGPSLVKCWFSSTEATALASLRAGETLSIIGTCSGKTGPVMLERCSLEPKK